ncbi:MAG: alpha/beta hydrolase [Candidatus Aminicenantes bacterium]|nr:alpha/beta hydrolase [Candidatus Aminicenantes bacterium]
MAGVALELSANWGVLEPLQTESSLSGQVEELKRILEKNGDLPVVLIGFSWGAWLSFLTAAGYPELVKKLVLVGSGPFREEYAENILETRRNRLNREERKEVNDLMENLMNPSVADKDKILSRIGYLFSRADSFDPSPLETEDIKVRFDIHDSVWKEAAQLRQSGELLKLGARIRCQVVAIHGDYDPHPSEGVEKPLSGILKRFRFILMKNCGHMPWVERQAREEFFKILRENLI